MSARRRRSQELLNSSGAEAPTGEPIFRRYGEFVFMALAIAAGAIFLALLQSPASFYSAVMHKEASDFYKQPQTSRTRLQTAAFQMMRSGSALQNRSALDAMLRAIADSEHEETDASSALDAYRRDPHNDLTRLVSAMVVVFADAPQPMVGGFPIEVARDLYDKLAMILGFTKPTGVALTLHMEVVANLRPGYREHFSRPDVAMLMVEIDAPYFAIHPERYAAYWDGFPAMQRRLDEIAASLDAAGQHNEAATCRSWLQRPMLEVIEREPDTPMRLLCMDLLIRDLPEVSRARQSLVAMRDDFMRHAADSPSDRMDITGERTAIAPAEYRTAQTWLIAAITAVLIAAGAGGAYLIALVLSFLIGRQIEMAPRPFAARNIRWIAATALIVIAMFVCAGTASPRGPFSAHWTLQMVILSVWVGLSLAMALSRFHDRPSALPWTARMSGILLLAPITLYLLPPISIVEFSRFMDKWMHPMWAGILVASIGAIAALLLNIRRMRAVRKTAALICVAAAWLAMGAYAVHSAADVRLQEAAVAGRSDEFAARLGSDWKTRLLAPIKAELLGGGS